MHSRTWKGTCTTARTSGREFCVGGTGGRRQKRWWAGASDSSWRSLGEFWSRGGEERRGGTVRVSREAPSQEQRAVALGVDVEPLTL